MPTAKRVGESGLGPEISLPAAPVRLPITAGSNDSAPFVGAPNTTRLCQVALAAKITGMVVTPSSLVGFKRSHVLRLARRPTASKGNAGFA